MIAEICHYRGLDESFHYSHVVFAHGFSKTVRSEA